MNHVIPTSLSASFYSPGVFPLGILFGSDYMNLERCELLLGKEQLDNIVNKKILIVGIGGVGGYTLETLVRLGINNITIADYDIVDSSNLNRQIISNMANIGKKKVDIAHNRYTKINPDIQLTLIKDKITIDNFNDLINQKYDYIVDACDDSLIKVELIKYALNNNIKIISSCGTANRIDASKLKITTLDKTEYDPLAKKLRNILRKENITLKIPVVSSIEKPIKCNGLGSVSYVPATAGLLITNYIINDICNK